MFGEALGGKPAVYPLRNAEETEPSRYPKIVKLWIDGVEVTTDYTEMAALLSIAQRERMSNQYPPKPDGWLSNVEMRSHYVGAAVTFKALFAAYAERKLQELIDAGTSAEAAKKEVAEKYVGIYSSGYGQDVLCASPEGIAEIAEQENLKPLSDKAPPKPDGWLSNVEMTKHYVGNSTKFKTLFEAYAENKIRELVAGGTKEIDAKKEVAEKCVGIYDGGGREALCASPEVVAEIVEKEGLLKRAQAPEGAPTLYDLTHPKLKGKGIGSATRRSESLPDY